MNILKVKNHRRLFQYSVILSVLLSVSFFVQAGALRGRKTKTKTVHCPQVVRHGTSVNQQCLSGNHTIVCQKAALEGVRLQNEACNDLVTRCPQTATPSQNISADCEGLTNVLRATSEEAGECSDHEGGRKCIAPENCETQVNSNNEKVTVCTQCTTTTKPVSDTSDDPASDSGDSTDNDDGNTSSSATEGTVGGVQ